MKSHFVKAGRCLGFGLALLSFPRNADAQDHCELHIFPTDEITLATKLGNYGLLSDMLAGTAPAKSVILRELPFDAQLQAAKSVFSQNSQFSEYEFYTESQIVGYKSATKSNGRLTGSNATCYAELALTNIAFSDSALTDRKIGVMTVLREFSSGLGKPKITKMGGSSKLEIFPASEISLADAARDDLASAFKAAVQQSVDKFLKPKH